MIAVSVFWRQRGDSWTLPVDPSFLRCVGVSAVSFSREILIDTCP